MLRPCSPFVGARQIRNACSATSITLSLRSKMARAQRATTAAWLAHSTFIHAFSATAAPNTTSASASRAAATPGRWPTTSVAVRAGLGWELSTGAKEVMRAAKKVADDMGSKVLRPVHVVLGVLMIDSTNSNGNTGSDADREHLSRLADKTKPLFKKPLAEVQAQVQNVLNAAAAARRPGTSRSTKPEEASLKGISDMLLQASKIACEYGVGRSGSCCCCLHGEWV